MSEKTNAGGAGSTSPCSGSVKIIQILIAPNDSCWQGVLLGLGNDGITYHCESGYWEKYIPPVGYTPNAQISGGIPYAESDGSQEDSR